MESRTPTWRAVITTTCSAATIDIHHGLNDVVLQHWQINLPDTTPAQFLRADAARHGWSLAAEDLPTLDPGTYAIPATPHDWERILAEVTQRRADRQAELTQLETVWQHCIIGARAEGHLGPMVVANAAGITRGRVYQIMRAHEGKQDARPTQTQKASSKKESPQS